MPSMRSKQPELATRGLHTDHQGETVSASTPSEIHQRTLRRLPSSLRKPSLRTYFDWDDRGNDDYTKRPVLLDLFSGAGGAAFGYYLAGFRVIGVDVVNQPHYPFEFHQEDALEYLVEHGQEFDAIHASPPCQAYSVASVIHRNNGKEYPDLILKTRELLNKSSRHWIIENVPGAPLLSPIMLCGLMFELRVFRHRLFETSFLIVPPEHPSHKGKRIGEGYYSVAGSSGRWKSWGTVKRNVSKGTVKEWRESMGIDWMTRKELTQAIPPAYTEYIGRHLIAILEEK